MKQQILISLSFLFIYGCSSSSDSNNTADLPTLTTVEVSSITTATAVSGGVISSDGGASILERGVCWSTSANPNVSLTTKTTDGTGIGTFTSNISGLAANITYYVRAYATNSVGTAYGTMVSFTTSNPLTDIDGNTYQLVTICDQTWTKTNLNVSKYKNGDVIPQVTNPSAWANLTTGAWCYYNNDSSNGAVYGKLYNWYAVVDPRGLAPLGYHIPTDNEWTTLTTCLGGLSVAGGKMKATGTSLWLSPNTGASNSCGFTAIPGGYRFSNGTLFDLIGHFGGWWSSTGYTGTNMAWPRSVYYNDDKIFRSSSYKADGYSIRCLKD
ncbi:fibrobacter succinogenes major paralogous domain-containing protein [Flavobacterium sp.]|jgi:uncharacterized protein (TIGR02145 family)|uniref:fibrobacter succinogenes major paralogous domain-containing protein n=1 Tax=Flavobacterium sp. TaxID=239 RepID=UPI0037BEB216